MLASLGAKFTPRSCASPASEASSSTYHTVLPFAVPGYSGSRTVSLLRSTWSALSSVSLFRGSRPVDWPSPPALTAVALAGAAFAPPDPTVVSTAETATSTAAAAASHHLRFKIFICCPSPPAGPEHPGAATYHRAVSHTPRWCPRRTGFLPPAGAEKDYGKMTRSLDAAAGGYVPVSPPRRAPRPAAPRSPRRTARTRAGAPR